VIFGESRLKDLYRRVVWGMGPGLSRRLPPVWEMWAADGGGRLAAAGLSKKRQGLESNLQRAFPERSATELRDVAMDAFSAHFANQYLSFAFPKCTIDTWPQYIEMEGLDRLQKASELGKGVVLMHPHMGPAQLPLHVLGLSGWPMHQVGGGQVTLVELSETGQWAADRRSALERVMPVTLHDGKAYMRPLLRALENGGVVMSACDATGGGHEIGRRLVRTVLGQAMPLPVGPVWMALRSGAPLLTVHCVRRNGGGARYCAVIGDEVELPREKPLKDVLDAGADAIAAYLNRVLAQHPGDWLFWDGFEPGGLLVEDGGL